ncbi:MAG: capsular biosynthesis protein [Halothiobacillaceae bacterium]|nr:capsular biosynthesis protein [Halothiobacillaceae bacterium]
MNRLSNNPLTKASIGVQPIRQIDEPTVDCLTLKQLVRHQNILLLQGPIGPFFAHLTDFLSRQGCRVLKIHLNGGDELFYRRTPSIAYRGTPQAWPEWLEGILNQHHIDAIVLFGEWRIYHRSAWSVADRMGIKTYVFEEGYLRPNYVTFERHGVNGNSLMPRDAAHYRSLPLRRKAEPCPIDFRFSRAAGYAMRYNLAAVLMHWRYPHYQHHRRLNPLLEGLAWVRSALRKSLYAHTEKDVMNTLASTAMHKRYFLVPLQVFNDSQVLYHSNFASVENFIRTLVQSFAEHAPAERTLVLKHHPMDRGYTDYTALVKELSATWHLHGRLIYIHDGHLPTLQKNACGVVTINSTVGLSSLYHAVPVKLLGAAVYDVPGLVSPLPLETFWQTPGEVDQELFFRYKRELIRTSQLNANFYTPSSYTYAFTCCESKTQPKA